MNYPWESRIKACLAAPEFVQCTFYHGWSHLSREGVLTSCWYSESTYIGVGYSGYHTIRERTKMGTRQRETRYDTAWFTETRSQAADIAFFYYCSEYGIDIPESYVPGRISRRHKKYLFKQIQAKATLSELALQQFKYYLRIRD